MDKKADLIDDGISRIFDNLIKRYVFHLATTRHRIATEFQEPRHFGIWQRSRKTISGTNTANTANIATATKCDYDWLHVGEGHAHATRYDFMLHQF